MINVYVQYIVVKFHDVFLLYLIYENSYTVPLKLFLNSELNIGEAKEELRAVASDRKRTPQKKKSNT
jgi:hypothetical protein